MVHAREGRRPGRHLACVGGNDASARAMHAGPALQPGPQMDFLPVTAVIEDMFGVPWAPGSRDLALVPCQHIRRTFAADREAVMAGQHDDWRGNAHNSMAAVVLLDQVGCWGGVGEGLVGRGGGSEDKHVLVDRAPGPG